MSVGMVKLFSRPFMIVYKLWSVIFRNMNWKSFLTTIGIIFCLFFCIPIKINVPEHSGNLFQAFVTKYNKSYGNNETEYQVRYQYFKDSIEIIKKLNENRTKGSARYGITEFCDLSREEFVNRHLQGSFYGKKRNQSYRKKRSPVSSLPEKIDWRTKGVVTAIRNQKTCGACWAFSTIETVESMNALKNRTLKNLSVQQAIDCAQNGNKGCEGGSSLLLLEWLKTNKIAIETEAEYPFTQETDSCGYKPTNGVVVQSYTCKNMVGGEEAMMDLLANHGPFVSAVNAVYWQFYLGGIIQYHCDGGIGNLNHAVQIVGYMNSGDTPYFIAKNSWGDAFGDKGYLYLSIGKNICGIADEVCSLDVV